MDNNPAQQSKNDSLVRGEAFRSLIRSEGWKFIKAYFENKVQAMATALLVEDKPIAEYEGLRHELIGLRKLIGFIDNDIKTLEDEAKKDSGVTK